eukprot:6909575-Pyramimonas_sp.AAC.3
MVMRDTQSGSKLLARHAGGTASGGRTASLAGHPPNRSEASSEEPWRTAESARWVSPGHRPKSTTCNVGHACTAASTPLSVT